MALGATACTGVAHCYWPAALSLAANPTLNPKPAVLSVVLPKVRTPGVLPLLASRTSPPTYRLPAASVVTERRRTWELSVLLGLVVFVAHCHAGA